MEDDEIVILASDTDSDASCSAFSNIEANSTEGSVKKLITIHATDPSSKLCTSFPTERKELTLGRGICERNIAFPTRDQNGEHHFNRNTNSKTHFLPLHGGCQTGYSCETDVLCDLKREDSSPGNVRNDGFVLYSDTDDDNGICIEEGSSKAKNERSYQIMNNSTMNSKEKIEFKENGSEPSTSNPVSCFVDDKCVSAEKNTFEELFEDDIQMALALSLQPHYMPKLESFSCEEDESVKRISSSDQIMENKIDKTPERNDHCFEKIKKRKKSKQLIQATKYRKVSYCHSQEFNSKDYLKKKKEFRNTIKPIRINVDNESEDDFSDELPDIDDVQIINTPVKKEFQCDIVNSVLTTPLEYDSLDDFEIPAKQIKLSQDKAHSTKKDPKSNLLFTSEHKNKLAKLLSAVSYKSKPKKDKLIALDGETNDYSEGSRHWMDCLDSLNQTQKIPYESDYQSDTSLESIKILASSEGSSGDAGSTTSLIQRPLRSLEYCQIDDSRESVAPKGGVEDSILPNYTQSKVCDTQEWIDQNVNQCAEFGDNAKLPIDGTNITSVISIRNVRVEATEPIDSVIVQNHSYTNQYYTSINNVKFSSDTIDKNLLESFSAMHIYSLEAALEEGDAFFDCSLDILKGFVVQKKPTVEVLDDILFKGLLGKYSANICVKCYNILRFVWQTYPDLIQIDWNVLSDKIGGVTYQSNSSCTTNLQSGLLLHLYVFGFEINIFQNSIRNRSKLIRTFAFRLLSEDCAFSNLKLIITWIEFCINSSSHEGITEAFLQGEAQMPVELTEKHLINFDAPYKLLPDLNRLLELGIDISKNCLDASGRIASELEKTYIYASDIKQKKILIHLVCSDLLRLRLIQRIMEDYCEGIVPIPTNFPVSFTRLKDSYFSARPPRSPLCTPPQSPNNGEFHGGGNIVSDYTPESVEELSLLVYYAAKSYLNCIKRCLLDPLHQRICQKNIDNDDKSALETLPERAMEFYRHLQHLNPELTPAAQQNCIMLTCLSETYFL